MQKRLELLVTSGEMKGRRFAVRPGGLRLGRSSMNDIHVPDEELSRNHCLFEPSGEIGLRVTDLASANGTYVNDHPVGNTPVELDIGDIVRVGQLTLQVVGRVAEERPSSDRGVDLGLGTSADSEPAELTASDGEGASASRRFVLWPIAAGAIALAAIGLLLMPQEQAAEAPVPLKPENDAEVAEELREMSYEKVEATGNRIFRYAMKFAADGTLSVSVDDVPGENRHVRKAVPLKPGAVDELKSILAFSKLQDIDREYFGAEPDPPALESWSLKAVYASRVRTIRIVNTPGPEAFRTIREKLEAFTKNELGVWAIQYSREKLVELAQESFRLGEGKWEDREVNYANLSASISAYRESMFYLETVDPKPDFAPAVREGLDRSTAELKKRYADQRFRADRAINLKQWEEAQRELQILLEMVPDRADDRNREASAKLVDVEKRIKK